MLIDSVVKMLKFATLLAALFAALASRSFPHEIGHNLIQINSKPSASKSLPISPERIVGIREVHEPRLSPDGKLVAFLVRGSFLECNCSRTALFIVKVNGQENPEKIIEAKHISRLGWLESGKDVSALVSLESGDRLSRINLLTREVSDLVKNLQEPQHNEGPYPTLGSRRGEPIDHELSADRRKLLVVTQEPPNSGPIATGGFRYDDREMSSHFLLSRGWEQSRLKTKLWEISLKDGAAKSIATLGAGRSISWRQAVWSPDGKLIAAIYAAGARNEDSIEVINPATGETKLIAKVPGTVFGVAWSHSANYLALLSRKYESIYTTLSIVEILAGKRTDLSRETASSEIRSWLNWTPNDEQIMLASSGLGLRRELKGLYAVSTKTKGITRISEPQAKLSECDAVLDLKTVCIRQAPNEAPRPSLIDLKNSRVVKLSDVNPQLSSYKFELARELRWSNAFGQETNGFLLTPSASKPTKGYPLVLIAYGFDGDFVAQASANLSAYPAQAFAALGIAVLLINDPRFSEWSHPDFARGSMAWGYGPLSSAETIIKKLNHDGLIDKRRVGFMGHSWGGFWVQFAISNSDVFAAAEINNGGTCVDPGSYWFYGDKATRDVQDHFMGGGPYRTNISSYFALSATLNADRVRVPVLMQYDANEAVPALEYYTALRSNNASVDFVIYPDDGHVLSIPRNRLYAMRRNLGWFSFWLQGLESVDPADTNQYIVWRNLRTQNDDHLAGLTQNKIQEAVTLRGSLLRHRR